MADIISKMRSSGIKLLQTEAEDFANWSKLKHTKEDLELFLNFNIAEMKFTASDGKDHQIICTSNTTFIKLFSVKKEADKKKIASLKSDGIRTKSKKTVNTWDLVDNKTKTIPLSSWQLINFISISPQNILVLHELTSKLLKI